MAWKAIDRKSPVIDPKAAPVLSEAVRKKIESFLPRYETKRAALLPALHVVQDELGHVDYQAMKEAAELLELPPSAVLDTLSFYTHFWTQAKGRKVITVCRSVCCEVMGGITLLEAIKAKLGIDEHQTTPDGEYSLVTEECLALCDYGPCMLINEKVHKCVRPEDLDRILADPDNDAPAVPRSDRFDGPHPAAAKGNGKWRMENGEWRMRREERGLQCAALLLARFLRSPHRFHGEWRRRALRSTGSSLPGSAFSILHSQFSISDWRHDHP
ncbi:MAG: NAD(P)H-dependent oxidoreductase subunit E [Planctomycetota bacterium]